MLADEINRATPKTQSALLEAMQERRVTVMGESHPLPLPFFVLATQNPIELEGTYPLPEAQLDRFTFKINIEQVASQTLEQIISTRKHGRPAVERRPLGIGAEPAVRPGRRRPLAVGGRQLHRRLVSASHPNASDASEEVRRFVRFGALPRAAIALAETARAAALVAGRPNVSFDDVRRVARCVLQHRLLLDYWRGWKDGRRPA